MFLVVLLFNRLLMKKRESQKLLFDDHQFEWQKSNQEKMLTPDMDDERYVFKLIRKPELICSREGLLQNIRELLEFVKK